MGVFEKLPYLNYHDINLDWLVRQTKKNASDNSYLMKIFKWFQDQGLVGTVTNVTENPDDTVKIDYADVETMTTDDFTVYNKNGVDGLVSGLAGDISGLDGRLDTAEGNITNLQGDVSGLDGRLDTAEGDITNLQGRMGTAEGNITSLQNGKVNILRTPLLNNTSKTISTSDSFCFLVTVNGYSTLCRGAWLVVGYVTASRSLITPLFTAGSGVTIDGSSTTAADFVISNSSGVNGGISILAIEGSYTIS